MKHLKDKLVSLVWRWLLLLLLAHLGIVAAGAAELVVFQRQELSGTANNLVVMDDDSDHPAEFPLDAALTGSRIHPTISPDMKTVVFSAQTVGGHYRLFRWEIDENNMVVGAPKRVIPTTTDENWGDEFFPAFSHDGTRLALLVDEGGGGYTLRVMNSDGSNVRILQHVNLAAPLQWRADDSTLLYLATVGDIQQIRQLFLEDASPFPFVPFVGRNIIAACYSPDGNHVAALIAGDGVASLEVTLSNSKTRVVLPRITNAKCIGWPHTGSLLFNATKVGEQSGKALWSVGVDGTGLQGISGYTIPRLVSYFAMRQQRATGVEVPPEYAQSIRLATSVINANNAGKGNSGTWNMPLNSLGQYEYNPPRDTTIWRNTPFIRPPIPFAVQLNQGARMSPAADPVLTGVVNFVRPLPDSELRGTSTIIAYVRRSVASTVLRIEGEVIATLPVQVLNAEWGLVRYSWNTREWQKIDLTSGKLPGKTNELQRFPDGQYMLTLTGMNMDGDVVGRDFVNVNVANELPMKMLPSSLALTYPADSTTPDERYRVVGFAAVDGAPTAAAPRNAVLDLFYNRRALRMERGAGLRWQVLLEESANKGALILPAGTIALPEEGKQVLYLQTPEGVVVNDRKEVIPTLTMLVVPFTGIKSKQFGIGMTWDDPMWVVGDLLDRTAWKVPTKHQVDGVERIGGNYYVRIRSEFRAQVPPALALAPTIPGFKVAPSAAEDTTPAMRGVRYSWFDFTAHSFLRVEDYIIYDLPGAAHYTVRYTYLRQ